MKLVQTVTVLRDALYAEAHMAARHFVAELNLDQLLERRSEAVAPMPEALRERAETWDVEVLKPDVKDLMFPGEMKLLLNQIIEAEKKAAAQVIYRREEVASTCSMANTAEMLDRNPALLRLKETITVYFIASRNGLVRTLTHEFGHALGLAHLPAPEAVMRHRTAKNDPDLTFSDIQAIRDQVVGRHSAAPRP